jgi:hypothetical protein
MDSSAIQDMVVQGSVMPLQPELPLNIKGLLSLC